MKYFYPVVFACLLMTGIDVRADDGDSVFESLRCGVCHKVDTGKTGPSLKEIAQAYEGKEDQILNYLNGQAEALIKTEKGRVMKRYIEKTKALSGGERQALADFILDHRE